MIYDIKKSISATLYERSVSPLFGSFFFTWIIWNWKIILILFLTESDELKMTKIEYIDLKLLNFYDGLLYPIISTIILLTVYAWLSEQAYRLWLYFDKRKNDYKTSNENKKLLTIEQSMKLRLQLSNQEEGFANLLKEKEALIDALKKEKTKLLSKTNSEEINIENLISEKDKTININKDLENFLNNKYVTSFFESVANYVQKGRAFDSTEIPDTVTSHFLAYNLIENTTGSRFKFTEKGKEYLKKYFQNRDN
jgi:hypothetical protein